MKKYAIVKQNITTKWMDCQGEILINMDFKYKLNFKILTNNFYVYIIIINILINARNKKSKLVIFFRELRVLQLSKIAN